MKHAFHFSQRTIILDVWKLVIENFESMINSFRVKLFINSMNSLQSLMQKKSNLLIGNSLQIFTFN